MSEHQEARIESKTLTENQAKYTPTPWKLGDFPFRPPSINIKSGDIVVAEVTGAPSVHANAAFIVRACNSHDALVMALKGAKVYYGTRPRDRQGDMLMEEIEAALAKAKP